MTRCTIPISGQHHTVMHSLSSPVRFAISELAEMRMLQRHEDLGAMGSFSAVSRSILHKDEVAESLVGPGHVVAQVMADPLAEPHGEARAGTGAPILGEILTNALQELAVLRLCARRPG